jgi:hypothetical protein
MARPSARAWENLRSLLLTCALGVVSCGGQASSPDGSTEAGSDTSLVEAGGDVAPIESGGGCDNCADESLVCDVETGQCVQCVTDDECAYLGNDVCLSNHTCGCTADAQCAGRAVGTRCVSTAQQCGCDSPADCPSASAPACATAHQCGCGSNAECAGDAGAPGYDVCDTATGLCVECVTDSDCTDPNNRVCDPTTNLCLPCRTSADCAQNVDGPVCGDLGQYTAGIGMCGCLVDSDCVGHAGGPDCVSNGSPYSKCGCKTAADCAGDVDGHACVNPYTDGWLQCGCMSTTDCASGTTCMGTSCQ